MTLYYTVMISFMVVLVVGMILYGIRYGFKAFLP